MLNLRQILTAAIVMAAVLGIGATMHKTAPAGVTHCQKATLAGGCFWSLQETLRQIPGVIKTTVGYTGGTTPNPTYEQVAGGKTGHTEAVEILFDPVRLSYEQLLADFLAARNPAPPSNRINSPHRSIIFYQNEEQRQIAERARNKIGQSEKWNAGAITEIDSATKFYPAEEYHQDYYQKTAALHACEMNQD
jgi:methionine-S-sulfoxide reductase